MAGGVECISGVKDGTKKKNLAEEPGKCHGIQKEKGQGCDSGCLL